jgi:hypothetical protein
MASSDDKGKSIRCNEFARMIVQHAQNTV